LEKAFLEQKKKIYIIEKNHKQSTVAGETFLVSYFELKNGAGQVKQIIVNYHYKNNREKEQINFVSPPEDEIKMYFDIDELKKIIMNNINEWLKPDELEDPPKWDIPSPDKEPPVKHSQDPKLFKKNEEHKIITPMWCEVCQKNHIPGLTDCPLSLKDDD
ncbi:MAG: hypothetical protein ABIF17_00500, partial [Patescibacteria group bacterium]